MEKISACLVVHNEEALIGRCLNSLRDVVDEIIVVHDGPCHDQTLEIAKQYGAKMFIQPFAGGAEEHRPFSFEQASFNWILQIDADEFLSQELKNNLPNLPLNQEISAYEFFWPLWNGAREVKAHWPYKRILFRKDKISFLGILQFAVQISGKVERTNFKLHHQPAYNNYSFNSFLKKQLPWAKVQAGYYFKEFSQIKKFNYLDSDWSKTIKYRLRFPLVLLPSEFVWTFLNNIKSGAYRAGYFGFKVSFITGLYRAAVNYYIYKLKNKINNK